MKRNLSLYLLYLFSACKNMMFFGAVTVPFFLVRAGLDYTQMFILETLFSLSMIVFEIPTGVIADKFGRRISLFLGALVFGGSFLLIGFFPDIHFLMAGEVLCGLGMTMLSGADRALIYDILKSEKRTEQSAAVLSRYDGFGTMGMLIAFPLGSFFVGSHITGYQLALSLVFVATGGVICLSAFLMFLVREPPGSPSETGPLKQGIEGFLFIFKKPPLRMFSLNYAAISSLTFFMFWFYQTLLEMNAMPVGWNGIIASAFNLSAMVLLFFSSTIQKRVSSKNMLFITSLGPGLLYLLITFVGGLPAALIAIFGITNMRLYRQPMLTALMNEHIKSSNRATVLSGVSMVERILTACLYPAAGLLADRSPNFAFGVLGIITVLLSLLLRVGEERI